MSLKGFLFPVLVISLGYLLQQHCIPHLARTYSLLGLSRTRSHLPGACAAAHADKFHGCEDMHLVEAAGRGTYLFAACLGSYESRGRVQSHARTAREAGAELAVRDRFWRWELESDEVVELELVGFPPGVDRAWHGFDVNVLPDGTLSIYVVNHRSRGSVVEKFTHSLSTDVLAHKTTIPLPATGGLAKHPNDIYALPARDAENAFYVTSDCRHSSGVLQVIERYARRPWSHLAYHSATAGWKLALDGISMANGITGDKGGSRVYVSELLDGQIIVLEQTAEEEGVLELVQKVRLGFLGDNPSLSADAADLYVAGHVKGLNSIPHLANPDKIASGSAVARISTRQLGSGFFGSGYTSDPVVEEIFVDLEGRLVNASSTAVWWDKRAASKGYGEREREREDEDEDEDEGEGYGEDEIREEGHFGDLFITGLTGKGILRCSDLSKTSHAD